MQLIYNTFFTRPFNFLSFILLLFIIIPSCNNDGLNDEDSSCVNEVLISSEHVRLSYDYLNTEIDEIFVGEWEYPDFRRFAGQASWNFQDWNLLENSYSFEGKRVDFFVKYENIEDGDTTLNTVKTEIIFRDDFEWIESYKSDVHYTWTYEDSYASTHIELVDIPFLSCEDALNYSLPITKEWMGFEISREEDINQENIKSFSSSGKYYSFIFSAMNEWSITDIKVSDDYPIRFDISIYP